MFTLRGQQFVTITKENRPLLNFLFGVQLCAVENFLSFSPSNINKGFIVLYYLLDMQFFFQKGKYYLRIQITCQYL